MTDHEDEDFRGVDWYARALVNERFIRCDFTDSDLTEAATEGCVFEECTFGGARLNASTHLRSAFVRCALRHTNLFAASFDACKLAGTVIGDGCTLRPLRVVEGDWSFVTLRGVNLSGVSFTGVRLRECDLSMADLTGASLRGCDLTGAVLRGARLTGCDLRETQVAGVDLTEVDVAGAVVDTAFAVSFALAYGAEITDTEPWQDRGRDGDDPGRQGHRGGDQVRTRERVAVLRRAWHAPRPRHDARGRRSRQPLVRGRQAP